MKRIVILGGGFGGAACARELEKFAQQQNFEVVLINRQNFFVFTPLLIEAGTGSLEPRHTVVPLRDFLKRTQLITAEVTGLDQEQQKVMFKVVGQFRVDELEYDHLVVALGSVTRMADVPGLREYGFEMKDLADAVSLRDRVIQLLEQAEMERDPEIRKSLLNLVVVGANFSGVEVAGELFEFFREAAKRYKNIKPGNCHLTVVEIADRILPMLDDELAHYGLQKLRERGIRVMLETSIEKVTEDMVVLDTEEKIPTQTLIWCAGIKPNPLVKELGLACDERGTLLCDPDLRVQHSENIWSIGDVAKNPDGKGGYFPPTAQHAIRMGKHLAHNILQVELNGNTKPCKIVTKGYLAALGCPTAVARVFGFKISGFPAWFLWRTVYLMIMPGFARKIRVALDWTISLFFPKQIVQLGVHKKD